MNEAICIRPSKDIRTNYAKISELAKKNPVAITVNGKEDSVLLSHADYNEQKRYISDLEARLAVYDKLALAADDVKLGRVQNANEAFDLIKNELLNSEL